MYFGRNISSTESDVDIHMGKALIATDRSLTMWKSDYWYNKMGIPLRCSHVNKIVWLHNLDFNETFDEKTRWELQKNAACCLETNPGGTTEKKSYTAAYLPSQTIQVRWARYGGHC